MSGGFCGAHLSREESEASASLFWACQKAETVVNRAQAGAESTTLALSARAQPHFALGVSFGSSPQSNCKRHQLTPSKTTRSIQGAPNIQFKCSYKVTLQPFQITTLHAGLMNVAHPERSQYLPRCFPCASAGETKRKGKSPSSIKSLSNSQLAQTDRPPLRKVCINNL